MNKTLLVFFGDFRTFDLVIPHLKDLDKVDIIISTWSTTTKNGNVIDINENVIREVIPNIKQIFISDSSVIKQYASRGEDDSHWMNTRRMIYHWKLVINNIENLHEYNNILFQRCDLVSNWENILTSEIEKNTLYLNYTDTPYVPSDKYPNAHWCNDYIFFGDVTIVNKFINSINEDKKDDDDNNQPLDSHRTLYETLVDNNINYTNYSLRGYLYREDTIPSTDDDFVLGLILGPPKI